MKKIIVVICFLFCIVSGCASDKHMRNLFAEKDTRCFIDKETGNEYIVTHTIGDQYNITLLRENKKE